LRRRLLGWALLLYGIIGLVLVLGGALAGLDAAARVERLAASASGTLGAASRSIEAAAAAFTNVDASLDQSQASAGAAATLARDASVTLGSLGQAMRLSVFGAQPLLPLADDFADSAAQASALAGTLDNVAASLDDTRADVTAIGDQLDELATELETLRDASGTGEDPPPVRLIVLLLVAWLLVPALGGIVGGLVLLRLPDAPAAVP
jgi:methyl-accepting chemotaxis protein